MLNQDHLTRALEDLEIQTDSLRSLIEAVHRSTYVKVSDDLGPGLFHLERFAGEIHDQIVHLMEELSLNTEEE